MAITLPGTGQVVATEDIGGEDYQKLKVVDGRPGSVTPAGVRDDYTAMMAIEDLAIAIQTMLERIENPMHVDPVSGRLRVLLDPSGGAQTLGTVTTVTNITNIGGFSAAFFTAESMHNVWANSVLGGIQ